MSNQTTGNQTGDQTVDEYGEIINNDQIEPILDPKNSRFTTFPIEHQDIWDMYKMQFAAIWKAEEIDFSKDYDDFITLSNDEQHFIKMTLAFFAASDGIVNFNLRERFLNDVQIMEAQVAYSFQMMMENIHCVSGSTKILTSDGYKVISEYINKNVSVWNGEQFSNTIVQFTGKSELYRVELSNGMYLECTPEHKWFIQTQNQEIVFTKNLKVGDAIYKYDVPVINPTDPDLSFATDYSMTKLYDATQKYIVPINYSLKTKLAWLESICDSGDCINYNKEKTAIQISSINKDFLIDIQTMLTTMGILANIFTKNGKEYILNITASDVYKLVQLGFSPNRLIIKADKEIMEQSQSIKIISITKLGGIHDTYCFSEPLKHAGIFNGILTGQSETYSQMLHNLIKDPVERDMLFNAIKTVPSVKKMADWAFKWIDSPRSFAYRVVAFAIVEGIFFSGSFASIFWLKKYRGQGKLFLSGLTKSNEFIARDEGMHTDFACLMYSKLKYKLKQETINTIMKEAVEISQEFMSISIPCKFIGMNSETMNQYIECVADRLTVALGYNKIYNKANPFIFMQSIGLSGKTNFFESRATEYQQALIKREFELSDDF